MISAVCSNRIIVILFKLLSWFEFICTSYSLRGTFPNPVFTLWVVTHDTRAAVTITPQLPLS